MKKAKTFFIVALLAMAGSAHSADVITVPDVTIAPGGTAEVVVSCAFTEHEYVGFEAELEMPADGSVFCVARTGSALSDGDELECSLAQQISSSQAGYQLFSYDYRSDGNNSYKFSLVNFKAKPLPASGELFQFTIQADENAVTGTTYPVKLSKIDVIYNDAFNNPLDLYLDDVEFNIKVVEDDGRIHFAETDATLPAYTAGEKADVTMARTIKAGEWSTLVLPFNLTSAKATSAFGTDVQFAKYNGFVVDYGDDKENVTPLGITVNFTSYTIPARGNLAGGTPVLIKTSKDISEIKLDDVTLTSAIVDQTTTDENGTPGKFTGSLVKTVVPADGLFLSGNKFYYSTGKTNIKAFRGWFELGAVLDKETDFGANIGFVVDGELTSVDGFPSVLTREKGDVYTIQGLYVGRNLESKSLPAGVYIIDGKKMVIK